LGNFGLILLVGAPVLKLLVCFQQRFHFVVED